MSNNGQQDYWVHYVQTKKILKISKQVNQPKFETKVQNQLM